MYSLFGFHYKQVVFHYNNVDRFSLILYCAVTRSFYYISSMESIRSVLILVDAH